MKRLKTLGILALLLTGAAFVAAADNLVLPVQDDFESGSTTGWSGDSAVSNLVYSYTQAVGLPLTESDHAKVLFVTGKAVRAYTNDVMSDVSAAKRTVDLMVMAEELPDEDLPSAAGDEQFRVAVASNGVINLYHYGASAAQWTPLSTTAYPSGTWVRVTLNIVYPESAESRAVAQVLIDGSPCVTDAGYREAACTNAKGSWYKAAVLGQKLSQMDFTGVGGVDDVVFKATPVAPDEPAADAPRTNGVDYAWLIDNGIAADQLNQKASADSAYTAKQSYDAGVDPYSATPLFISNATATASAVTIRINGYKGAEPTAYKVMKASTPGGASAQVSATFAGDTTAKDNTSVTLDLPADSVAYYAVVSTNASVATTNLFGVMKVTSALTNTIVSAPWISLGLNDTPMNVADLVLTANLSAGDMLILFDGAAYKGWTLQGGVWTPTAIADTSHVGTTITAAAGTETLARGQGIWLVRQNPLDGDGNAKPFYLFGQYTSAAAQTTVQSGKTALLANPNPGAAFEFSAITPGSGDTIYVPGVSVPKIFSHDTDGWGYEKTTVTVNQGIKVQSKSRVTDESSVGAGQGFWYKSSTGDVTINW